MKYCGNVHDKSCWDHDLQKLFDDTGSLPFFALAGSEAKKYWNSEPPHQKRRIYEDEVPMMSRDNKIKRKVQYWNIQKEIWERFFNGRTNQPT